jgi:hypothetical protein
LFKENEYDEYSWELATNRDGLQAIVIFHAEQHGQLALVNWYKLMGRGGSYCHSDIM